MQRFRFDIHVIRLLKSASREANFLAVLSILLLVLKVFVLDRIPAPFAGAYETGIIVEGILSSVIASYLFYLFVIHLREFSDKETIQPYIRKHAMRVAGYCAAQVKAVAAAAEHDLSLSGSSVEAVTAAFRKIAPYSDSPVVLASTKKKANWFEYFIYYSERTRESIRRVLIQLPYADAKLVGILTSIDDCAHFHNIAFMRSIRVNNPDLSNWAANFSEYCRLCDQLHAYLADAEG
jgi:hypothetical protein